jgi:3-phenylpropionate/cinnamic acid dioxygenase small subunit
LEIIVTITAQAFGPALIGQTEKALNAILDRHLAGTGITEPQWVTLTLTVAGGGVVDRSELIRRVSRAAQFGRAAVAEHITELTAAGLLRDGGDGRVQVTDDGQAFWTRVRTATGPITQRLWGDLPADDLAAAGRVLGIVLDRANAVLVETTPGDAPGPEGDAMPRPTRIADRVEIADLLTRLALLLDEKRWEDAGTVFTDDVVVRSPRGGELRGLDEVVGFMRQGEVEGEHTQHTTTDLLVDVDGDRAAVSANSLVYYYRDGQAPHFTGGLRLAGTAVRTPAGWRLRDQRIRPAWTRES